ncbi:MBL fold metallo-hydrolase [Sulfolobus tengchongensis]|uniref:MBL fold metallo-hydrolase n=1 Tax=Sulfolobus tengchongensis TaxID=207809 RepID=A0AAX4L2B5_9CREN
MSWRILVPGVPIYTNLGFVGFCNVILIETEGKYIIYDPGHFGNKEYLLSSLKNIGLSPSDIDGIILSHMHYDHSLNSLIFPNAKIYTTKEEMEYTRNTPDLYSVQYLPDLIGAERMVLVKDGEETHGLKFVLLPGHTAGTLGVVCKDTIFVGDAIKYVIDARRKQTSFAYHNLDEANKSIVKAMQLARIIVPGHDVPFKVEYDRIEPILDYSNSFIVYIKNDIKITIKRDEIR